ncbi:MAG: glycosyltransferase [Aureibaculum sp.]
MKRIIVSVTNDLVTDQRVHKVCTSLMAMGFEIVLIGRKLPTSLAIDRDYRTIRMPLLFNKGFLFYAEYSLRLFLKLFFLKKDILLSNDLDTLLPNYIISKLFNKELVYDSHELFTEIPEREGRTGVKGVWERIERYIFPKLKRVYTVNDSIASFYKEKYKVGVQVVRNMAPELIDKTIDQELAKNIKGDQKMIILQGSGLNIDRGAEEAVAMMQYIDHGILYIIGGGDVFEKLKALVITLKLQDKVFIKNKMPYDALMEYTKIADLGLSLDKGMNLNYEYSLPNKVFDYIQAETPLLVSNRKEIAKLVNENNIGKVVDSHDPKELANIVNGIFADEQQLETWQNNLKKAAKKYTWENESKKLKEIFHHLNK